MLSRSAPVCFWAIPHWTSDPCWSKARSATRSGHCAPASTSTRPASGRSRGYALHARHVEHDRAGAELLASHRVATAGDADGAALGTGGLHGVLDVAYGLRLHDAVNGSGIELGMNVVDDESRSRPALREWWFASVFPRVFCGNILASTPEA